MCRLAVPTHCPPPINETHLVSVGVTPRRWVCPRSETRCCLTGNARPRRDAFLRDPVVPLCWIRRLLLAPRPYIRSASRSDCDGGAQLGVGCKLAPLQYVTSDKMGHGRFSGACLVFKILNNNILFPVGGVVPVSSPFSPHILPTHSSPPFPLPSTLPIQRRARTSCFLYSLTRLGQRRRCRLPRHTGGRDWLSTMATVETARDLSHHEWERPESACRLHPRVGWRARRLADQ